MAGEITMIRFSELEARLPDLRTQFAQARPFSHIVIDEFCDARRLASLTDTIPDPLAAKINKSRDYVFAHNKFEKSQFRQLGPLFNELYTELISDRMAKLLCNITGEDLFVDPDFHGGGIHQGGRDSFLDMHADFSHHPTHLDWFRNINILLYLNQGWQSDHKGELKLRHKVTKEICEVAPLFNRCVIMHTRDYTLHGYDAICFPEGQYRRSIAAYAYTLTDRPATQVRSTTWYPEHSGAWKRAIGRLWPTLVRWKGAMLGSATARNS
jgi:hypothetical protein